MPKAPINIIAETLNDSVPSVHELYESQNFGGIKDIAEFQDAQGAEYIDINVGSFPPDFFAEVIRLVQSVTKKPLSLDSPDPALIEAGLKVYDDSAGLPILNSISPLRAEFFAFYKIKKFRPILLISESENGACRTANETVAAAKFLHAQAAAAGIPNSDMIFDPGVAPVGSDSEGNLARLIDAMRHIHNDPMFTGFHASVGLSNFTVMLPPKRKDGSPVRSPLESAFLTRTMPLGMDYVIGSVKRKYEILPDDHPAMQCIDDCIKLGGFDAVKRVRNFYKN
ncbi:MAG: dihydropteroate synthase [Planctomycetaceae bacterium]|jgi:5-methyltetrahydrofolate--homocysteine methyltransferase|nr:dihydropteroate synthase [Planctomycetaceae bacterium]